MKPDTEHPLLDAIDLEILMHRDVHFGGNFSIMIEYYENEGVGCMPDFDLQRIYELKLAEEKYQSDLSQLMLPEPARAQVEEAQKVYRDLRSVYEENKALAAQRLSDLILSEEEEPREAIDAIAEMGSAVIDPLTDLLLADTFYDPLYPGYGRAPILAARCLEKIGDKAAIPALFQALGQENFFTDDAIIQSLNSFGEPAKNFLIKRLLQKPYSKDNDLAAIALSAYPEDPELSHVFLEVLLDEELQQHPSLTQYAVFGCSALEGEEDQKAFENLLSSDFFSKEIKREIEIIVKNRKKPK